MNEDFEARFLHVKVLVADAKCLRNIRRENQSDDLSTYEYTRHVSVPRIPLLVRIMLYNARQRITRAVFLMFKT